MIQIVKANKVKKNIKEEMSKLFVCSFFDVFRAICDNKEKLVKVFRHIFDMDCFYVVLLNDEVVGMGAVSDGSSSINFNKFKFYRYFGLKKGKNIYNHLNNLLVERDYDFEMDEMCGMIEFLAVKEEYRNKKIGFTFVNHVMQDNKYIRYLARVADNNHSALALFENIGFEEFHKEEASEYEKKNLGVSNCLYMIYQKNSK